MNRRIPNGTYGGVRRRGLAAPSYSIFATAWRLWSASAKRAIVWKSIGKKEMQRTLAIHPSQSVLVGLFGHPVHHSKSPVMHQAAFQASGLQGYYQAFDIPPERLPDAVAAIRTLAMRGVNITIPHKVAICDYLDVISPEAERIGAVNTIVNDNGTLIGTNTDGIGYVRSLQEELQLDLTQMHVLILGAGGAARAIATRLALEGAKKLTLTNRTYEKAEQLAVSLASIHDQVQAVPWSDLDTLREDVQVVINTTSVGMYPHMENSPLAADFFQPGMVASDLIYNPRQTLFLQQAQTRGCRIHEGVGMLVYQGAEAFRLWTGIEPPVSIMREALLRAL
jgi:shikimate dehydrogenase